MATWAILLAAGLYCLTAWDFAIYKGDWAMAGAFICYALANVCFAVIALR